MNPHVHGKLAGGESTSRSATLAPRSRAGRTRLWRTLAALTLALPLAALVGQSPARADDLPVGSDEDITAPQVTRFDITPLTVDVTDGVNKTLTATASAGDDLSGVASIHANYRLAGTSSSINFTMYEYVRVAGDALSGDYESTTTVTPLTANGTYELSYVRVYDAIGNYHTYTDADGIAPSSIVVVSSADAVPPTVVSFDATPNPVDVSLAAREIVADLHGTDDSSGLSRAFAYWRSPNGRQLLSMNLYPVAGEPGHLRGSGWIERYSEPGTWTLLQVCAYDAANNSQCYLSSGASGSNLSLADVTGAADLTVISDPADTTVPGATAFRLSPSSVDVTTGSATVDLELDVSDDLSGVRYAFVQFSSPSTQGATPPVIHRSAWLYAPPIYQSTWDPSTGAYDRVYDESARLLSDTLTGSLTFPQYDRSGAWTIQICLYDQVANVRCYSNTTSTSITDIGPGSFTVQWNRAPIVNVIGVGQAEYEAGTEPTTFVCDVVDLEDGTVVDVEPVVEVDGDTVTVTCTYTDMGINGGLHARTGTDTQSFTIVQPSNTPPTVQVTGVDQGTYELGSEPTPGCDVTDAEDGPVSVDPVVSSPVGALSDHGVGTVTVTCSYTDTGGLDDSETVTYEVVDGTAPILAGRPTTDPNGAGWYNTAVTIHWEANDGGVGIDPATMPADETIGTDGAGQTRTASVTDRAGNSTTSTSSPVVNIDMTDPVVSEPSLSVNPMSVDGATVLTAAVSDVLSGVVGGEWFIGADPGEGSGTPLGYSSGELTGSIGSLPVGVHTVQVRALDAAGNWGATTSVLLVVYDPDGGFATGGGWFDSPEGAYTADLSAAGKASFGFVSKYKKGATTPTGTTEFRFSAGNLNFYSSSYDWMVIAGARVQFKGAGAINGEGTYQFMLTASDADLRGGGDEDRIRMKIWSEGVVVYDSGLGADDGADPAAVLGGGNIMIHTKK